MELCYFHIRQVEDIQTGNSSYFCYAASYLVKVHIIIKPKDAVLFLCTTLRTVSLQLFKRRNVATVEDDGALEDDGMADSGYLESQANNMDPFGVRISSIKPFLWCCLLHLSQ